ncbi:MAG TPA: MraY family glycosyltransferase [Vicinamibacterales bacterium]|nr:MraY family glycosyltransferase [Vicinamibacterales bacterium]
MSLSVLLAEVCGTGLVLSAGLVPLACRLGEAAGFHAAPMADRWHDRAVPKSGGVAVAASVAIVVLLWDVRVWPLLGLCGAMFCLGLADDWRPIGAARKLVCQLLITGAFLYAIGPIRLTPWPLVDLALAYVWVVGITNAFNLLDNIDGLAAGVAAITACVFALLLTHETAPTASALRVLSAGVAGVAIGFLIYNAHPARIFMGDSGSLSFGSFMAGATLLAVPNLHASLAPVSVLPLVVLLVPILDTTVVTVTRRLAGRSVFSGGRDHLSHRLVALGLSDRAAVAVLYLATVASGVVALAAQRLPPAAGWPLVAGDVVVMSMFGTYLARVETNAAVDRTRVASTDH